MKKIIASITMLAAGAALASTVTSAQTFGVLKVTSSKAETVICVPWVAAGTGGDIKVKDVVKTSGLTKGSDEYGTNGDVLLKYDGSTYYGWALNNDGEWVGLAVVVRTGETATAGDDETLARGDALIIRRSAPANPGEIYLYGQYESDPVGTKTLTLNAWNLIAPPDTTGNTISLNSLTWGNVGANDVIYVQAANGNRIELTRNSGNTQWVYKALTEDASKAVIQPGQGAWYVSKETTGDAPTVTF